MKLPLAILLAAFTGAFSAPEPISANSRMGLKLLDRARNLENGDNDNDFTWMEDFSLKFLGCHQVAQWNTEADGEDDVRIAMQKFVRFRLCPSNMCSSNSGVGCTSKYGDYVVDMETFLEAYVENEEEVQKEKCESQAQNCGCDDGERKLEENGNDNDNCLYNCYYNAGMSACMDEEDDNVTFLKEYSACGKYDNGDERRKLDEEAVEYYIGPYCSAQGGEVMLGMFTDDTCTSFADKYGGRTTFATAEGYSLPYGSTSMIDNECHSCLKSDYYQDDDNAIREICTDIYPSSGKCENRISNFIQYPNENGCDWILGMAVAPIKSNGVIHAYYHGTVKAAIAIALFATTFVLLAFYVCFLRQRLIIAAAMAAARRRKKRRSSRSVSSNRSSRFSPKKMKRKFSFGLSRIFKKKKNRENREQALL